MLNKRIQIWILTRNRVSFLKQAIESILNQETSWKYEVIISDNSTNKETEEFVASYYPLLRYIRRDPPLDSRSHFRNVSIESECDFFVMFHDDDVVCKNYIEEMANLLSMNSNLVAVGCNSNNLIGMSNVLESTYLNEYGADLYFSNAKELLAFYFAYSNAENPVPLSGYMYRKAFINYSDFDINYGGKYIDVIFLSLIANKGRILWTRKVLMSYRIHGENDSGVHTIYDRISLLRYFISKGLFDKSEKIYKTARLNFWRIWFFSEGKNKSGLRQRTVKKYLIFEGAKLILQNPKFLYIYFVKYLKSRKIRKSYEDS